MNQKRLILIATAIVFFSFVAVSPAQAVVDPVSLTVIGLATLISLIAVDKAVESNGNDSMAKQDVTKHKTEIKLQAASNPMK